MQSAKLTGNTAIDEVVADARDHAADDGGIDVRTNLDLFADQLGELLLNHLLAGRVQRNCRRDVGDDDSLFLEQQRLEVLVDVGNRRETAPLEQERR